MKLTLLSLVGLMLAGSGCVGQRYVNQTLYGPTGKPAEHPEPLEVAAVPSGAANGVQLAGVPPPARRW